MKRLFLIVVSLMFGLLAGCEMEESLSTDIDYQKERVSFHSQWGAESDGVESRTILQENGHSVWWNPSDKIRIYKMAEGKTYWGRFTSSNSQPAPEATFYGYWNQASPTPNPGPGYWAVYPDDNSLEADYRGVSLVVPTNQTGCKGSFSKDLFPAMARCGLEENTLTFFHVCGGIPFSVTQEGVTRLSILSKGGEAISGKFLAGFDDEGKPIIHSISEGIDSVVVFAPEGGFVPGQPYFAVLLPQTLSQGVTIRLTKDRNEYAVPSAAVTYFNKSLTVKRACFGRLDNIDQDLTYEGVSPDVPDDIIRFADERIKTSLLKVFDTDRDGEISYKEAASATSMEGVFGTIKTYKSFDEFQYFISITDIPEQMFMDCAMLTSVTPPPSLRAIGRQAFKGCSSLQSFLLPASLETIGVKAFSGCTSLSELTIGSFAQSTINAVFPDSPIQKIALSNTIPALPDSAFSGLKFLSSIIIPESVCRIGSNAFAYCQSLSSIRIPRAVTRIEEGTFKWCTGLTTLDIPEGIQFIGADAFSYCELLSFSVSIPKEQPRIEKNTFFKCAGLTEVILPEGITSIESDAFNGCSALSSPMTIPESVTRIEKGAFSGCTRLPGVILPEALTKIEEEVFYSCQNLTSVRIPDGVTSIGNFAFAYCSGLQSVTLPNRLNDIGESAFTGCSITSLHIPDGTYVIWAKAFLGCNKLTDVHIPGSVTFIGGGAFAGCSSLRHIMLPESISSIEGGLFSESGLEEFSIPESITSIKESAFKECTSLRTISIPESIQSINSEAFSHCSALESIEIPASVNFISWGVLSQCNSLKWIIVRSTVPPSGPGAPFNGTGDIPIYVPDASVNAYKSASYWSEHAARIKPMSEFPGDN